MKIKLAIISVIALALAFPAMAQMEGPNMTENETQMNESEMNLTQQDIAEIQQLMIQIQERRAAMEQLMMQQGRDIDRLNELVGGENMTAENGTNGTNSQSGGDGGILDMLGDLLGGDQDEQNQSNQTDTPPA